MYFEYDKRIICRDVYISRLMGLNIQYMDACSSVDPVTSFA